MTRALQHAIAAALLAATPLVPHAVEVGQRAPEFELGGTAKAVRLADYRGKLVYLDFWASWCVPCRLSFPWMNAMQQKYGEQGLQVIGVNVDQQRADAERFLAAHPAGFPIAFDATGATPKAYAVKGMPASMLIGPDGAVQLVHVGFRAGEAEMLEEKIRAALATHSPIRIKR